MAYCHECGSEVAPIDAFCPYCGISLQPSQIAEETAVETETIESAEIAAPSDEAKTEASNSEIETADEEFSTIATNAADAEYSTITTGANLHLDGDLKETVEAEKPDEKPETENAAAPEEKQNDALSSDFSSIPTPAIIENLESFENASAKEKEAEKEPSAFEETEDFGLVEPEESSEESKNDEVSAPDAPKAETEEQIIGEEIDEEQAMLDRFTDAPTVETSETLNSETAENLTENTFEQGKAQDFDDFSATIPDIVPTSETPVTNEIAENSTEMETSATQENQSESNAEEDSISKPSDNLQAFEPEAAPSVFDSVRIMEDDEPPKENFARDRKDENITPLGIDTTPPTATENVSQSSENSEKEANLSHTTPNIGASGGDTDGKKAAKLKPLDEGTILNNRYEIIRKIGGGGMGAVYLASDNNLGGVLRAVKEMVQSYIEESQQEKSIEDFRRESMILSTLDHGSIPTIYDYFFDEKESRFYLVMKYINGGDLSGRLRAAPEGKIDEKTVTEWSIQIADVLDYLHNRPTTIVYRDLKPSNVMIDGNSERIMLIDFGIARSVKKEEKGVTAVGTMGYAPPELFSGNVEPRSDIYSLGSTMFHLLTGADPQNNPLLIFDFQKNPRPRQINPQLSDQMERILMKAVEYNSTARFASASEMKAALTEHLENLKANRVTYGVKEVPQAVSLANQMVFCGFCGQKIVASDMFCAFCGSKQPMSQQGVHAEIYSSGYQTARLVVLGTNDLESPMFNLDKEENFVGRRDPQSGIFPEVDLSKYDPQTKISRRHARIWRDGMNFMVEDLGSSNGTVVMPQVSDVVRLLPHQPHILASGDKIRVGDTTLHFVKG